MRGVTVKEEDVRRFISPSPLSMLSDIAANSGINNFRDADKVVPYLEEHSEPALITPM
jgi:hypothetical protein